MKKALIQFNQRIVQVSDSIFPVHDDLMWVDCPDDCAADIWTYSDGVCVPPPTVKWQIGKMDCYPESDGQTNVVFQVIWICWRYQNNYCVSVNGTTSITYQAESPYTPYDQLTQEQVLEWIWNAGVNKAAVELELSEKISALMNPSVVAPALPWV